nr:antirestriction protein ArdA [uncultured Oscillibacter sp.]
MAGLFEAHVANLGKYNEGVLAGEPLSFPASPKAVQALLKEIGAVGLSYPAKERAVTAVAAPPHFETKCPEASTSLLIPPGRVII